MKLLSSPLFQNRALAKSGVSSVQKTQAMESVDSVKFGKLASNFSVLVKEDKEDILNKLEELYEPANLDFWKTQSAGKRQKQKDRPFWGEKAYDDSEGHITQLLLMNKIKYNNPNTPILSLTLTKSKDEKSTLVQGTFTEVDSLWTQTGKTLPYGMAGLGVALGALVNPVFLVYLPIAGGIKGFVKKMETKESNHLKEEVLKVLNS